MKKITFLHTADLHLDSPMVGLSHLPDNIYNRLLNSTFTALKTLVDISIERKVDFLIIAGDVYDGEDRSIRAQVRFRQEMERLSAQGIFVYLTHGNHDHLSGTWTNITLPENVIVYGEEVEIKVFRKADITTHLYGFSYPKRQVLERMIEQYEKIDEADFHIGILHGNEGGNSAHDNYAPFQVTDLIAKQFDYWALGHIHKNKLICENPPILYPGNIQGRHHKEQGPKGCYIVSLTDKDYQLEWINTADVEWNTLEIDAISCTTFQEVYLLCLERMNQVRSEQWKGNIVRFEINNLQNFEGSESIGSGDLLEILQENEAEQENFVWVSAIQVKDELRYDKDNLKVEDGFFRELFQTIENYEQLNEAIDPLFLHQQARKHITNPSSEEQKQIIIEAERILLQLLNNKS
jgi:DNA repair protein SbcD/Mre11